MVSEAKEVDLDRQRAVLSREVDQRSVVRGSKWREVMLVACGINVPEIEEKIDVGEVKSLRSEGS